MSKIAPSIHPAIVRYSEGAISASRAADLLGEDATVHDVIAGLRASGLPLPRRPRSVELEELARARRILGSDRPE